ncbi:MAG: hypothetical protein AAF541_04835 [Pseudomonadota bacterium]
MDHNTTLGEKLIACGLREAANVTALLEAGGSIEFDTDTLATPPALLETYRTRSEHLAQFDSHHAQRLKSSTDEFCAELTVLKDDQSVAYARIDDSLLGSYIIWFVADTQRPVGCQYVIGKSEVSDEVWEDIWHNK